jgi:hypothetical protein
MPGGRAAGRRMRRRNAWFYVFTLVSLAMLAGCGGGTEVVTPPSGLAAGNVLTDASTALDHRKNGANAWMYNIDVGANDGQNRLLMYYILNNYGAAVSPPLGTDNDTQFAAAMKQITDQYNKADPKHPAIGSIDLVDPVADGVPGPDKLYRHYRDPADIDHYLKVARDTKQLFFFDTQVGWDTQQNVFEHFRPYLEQPDVHLALDPEWEMRPGVVPGQDRGRTVAPTIQWVVDQLSEMVISKHLPNKILVVHKFFEDEQWNSTNPAKRDPKEAWSNIQPRPGVTLIICIDGQGPPWQKIEKYNAFAKGETNLLGFKIFMQIPCSQYTYCEEPVMTPQQAIALKPAPVMVQYQ